MPIYICMHHHRPTKEAMFLFTKIHRQIACMHTDAQISFFGKHVICEFDGSAGQCKRLLICLEYLGLPSSSMFRISEDL